MQAEVSGTARGTLACGLLGLAVAGWAVFGLQVFGPPRHLSAATRSVVLLVLAAGGAMALHEAWWRRAWRANLGPAGPADAASRRRVLCKWLGLHLTLGLLALLYWLLPEYRKPLYSPFFQACGWLLPWLSLLAWPYIAWVDARMGGAAAARDAYWALGDALLSGRRPVLGGEVHGMLGQHALGWLVKGFFLPMMFGYAVRQVQGLGPLLHSAQMPGFRSLFELGFAGLYLVDVLWGTVGYLCALRLTDSHVRSTEPTCLGWLVALCCYEPLSNALWPAYLAYDAGKPWGYWLADSPMLYALWGSAILGLTAVYTWATLSFGLRFSNLSHRGIVSGGPYRWLQHPAYWAKNLSWWLISMPFMVSTSVADSLRMCALLLLVNALYALRAHTEQRHLGQDPQYRAYVAGLRQRQRAWWRLALRRGEAGSSLAPAGR